MAVMPLVSGAFWGDQDGAALGSELDKCEQLWELYNEISMTWKLPGIMARKLSRKSAA